MGLLGNKLQQSLKARLLFWVWLSSSVATFLFTMGQLLYEFQVDKGSALNQGAFIEKNYLPLIGNSMWDYDLKLLNLQIKSISQLNYVCSAKLLGIEGVNSFNNCLASRETEGTQLTRLKITKGGKALGFLEIGVDINAIESLYLKKSLKTFILQALKTFIVCSLLLYVFSQVIMNHLMKVSNFVSKFNLDENIKLELKRDNKINDELSALVRNINATNEKLRLNQEKLKSFNIELEKKVEERTLELDKARANAMEASKLAALGEMAGGVAHEINNPLAIISGSILTMESAKEKGFLTEQRFFKITQVLKKTTKRISDIVEGLRSVSRNEELVDGLECNLEEAFENVFHICKEKFKAKAIDFRTNKLVFSKAAVIHGNQVQLSQVIINLLNNAYDAVEARTITDKWIEIQTYEKPDKYQINILDSGAGVPPNIRDKIFNPFFTSKDIGRGTGLGLSISYSFIQKIGGRLYLDEESNVTCFVIELPKPKVS